MRDLNKYGFDPCNSNLDELRTEAVHTAAVCVALVECIDRHFAADTLPAQSGPATAENNHGLYEANGLLRMDHRPLPEGE